MSVTKSKFLLNEAYGGFGFSQVFRVEFLRRNPDVTLDAFRGLEMSDAIQVRADERFVNLAIELGLQESSGTHCCLAVAEVSTEALSFVRITEYDGLESFHLSFEQFALDLLHDIVSDEHTVLSAALRARYDILKDIL